jgi:hypothetical protein
MVQVRGMQSLFDLFGPAIDHDADARWCFGDAKRAVQANRQGVSSSAGQVDCAGPYRSQGRGA